MAASSLKFMSNIKTIREYKHPVREVRYLIQFMPVWRKKQHGDNSPTSFTNRNKSRNTAEDSENFPPRVWEGIVTNIDKYQTFIDSDEYDEFYEAQKLTIGFTILC